MAGAATATFPSAPTPGRGLGGPALRHEQCSAQNGCEEEESTRFWVIRLSFNKAHTLLLLVFWGTGAAGMKIVYSLYCWTSQSRDPHLTGNPGDPRVTPADTEGQESWEEGGTSPSSGLMGVSDRAKASPSHDLLAIQIKSSHLVSIGSWGDTTFLPKTGQES